MKNIRYWIITVALVLLVLCFYEYHIWPFPSDKPKTSKESKSQKTDKKYQKQKPNPNNTIKKGIQQIKKGVQQITDSAAFYKKRSVSLAKDTVRLFKQNADLKNNVASCSAYSDSLKNVIASLQKQTVKDVKKKSIHRGHHFVNGVDRPLY